MVCLLLLLWAQAAFASSSPAPKTIEAVRTAQAPVVDGIPDETVWQEAPPAADFTQYDPVEGGMPTERTEVRLLYDDDALYVGVACFDSRPDLIVPQLTRRDRTVETDRFTVQIDSYHDRQTAFVFSTSIAGVQSDGVLSQDGLIYDIQWDAVWEVRTHLGPAGWTAEFSIPFHALRFTPSEDGDIVWGINFRRYISRKRETIEWVMIPRTVRAAISLWGEVHGVRDVVPPPHLAVVPYLSGQSSFSTASDGRAATADQECTAGLDVKYGLTRNFTLDAAVNPDFGQVEVDEAVLNLTVFETLFPEKRPFFTEGSQLFSFGPAVDGTTFPLFFSRRIGKSPSGAGAVTGDVIENPGATTILGAAKVTGRTSSGLSLGVLSAMTDREEARVRLPGGITSHIRTEPRGAYQVVRLKQDVAPTSWIGGILTGVARENVLPALSGGVDWNLRLDEGRYAVDGYAAGAVSPADDRQMTGAAGRILLSRISSEHWFSTVTYDAAGRNFNSNDIGFYARPRDHGGYLQVLYRESFAAAPLLRYYAAVTPEFRWNWNGVRTVSTLTTGGTFELTNFWTVSLSHTYGLASYDDEDRGLIGVYRRPASQEFQASVTTDERSTVSASVAGGYTVDAREKQGYSASAQLKLRPASWIDLTPLVMYQQTRDELTGVVGGATVERVVQDGREYSLFGTRDVDLLNLALRGTFTFTTTLSLQVYGQVLLARGTYDHLVLLAGDARFLQPSMPAGSRDFNLGVFNANALVRWEFLPGSAAYLVWTQGRAGDSGVYGTGFGTRFGETLALPHDDVLLLKLSYWLPL